MATLKAYRHSLLYEWPVIEMAMSGKSKSNARSLDEIFERYNEPYAWPYKCCTALISDLTLYWANNKAPYWMANNMRERDALRHYASIFGGMRNCHSIVIRATGMIETLKKPDIGLIVNGDIYFPEFDSTHYCDDYMRAMPVFRQFKKWYAFTKYGLSRTLFEDEQLVTGWKSPRAFFYGY